MSYDSFPAPPPVQVPQITPGPVRRRKQSSLFTIALICGVVIASGTAAYFLLPGGMSQLQNAATLDNDLRLVRTWLSENLDSPKWTEVRWWPAKKNKEGDRVCRLKLRTANPLGGGQYMRDMCFVIENGKAKEMWRNDEMRLRIADIYPFDGDD